MSKQKTAVRSAAAGSPSDFFRQRPRFFAFYTFFPAVGTVKVSDGFIDRLTNCETGKFQALKVQGGSAPFFRSVSAGLPGRFFRGDFSPSPPLSHSLPLSYLLGWERIYISPVKCQVTLAYAIGKAEPVMVEVDTFGTGTACADDCLAEAVKLVFGLTPAEIISRLDLLTPRYTQTAAYGHFGKPEFPWERTDQAKALRAAVI